MSKERSLVWDYFTRTTPEERILHMQCKKCEKDFPHRETSIGRNHLKHKHPELHEELTAKEIAKKMIEPATPKRAVNSSNLTPQELLNRNIALLLAKPNFPIHLFVDRDFKKFIESLNYDKKLKVC